MENIMKIITMMNNLPHDHKESMLYFTAGMLYGMSVLEVDESVLAVALDKTEKAEGEA